MFTLQTNLVGGTSQVSGARVSLLILYRVGRIETTIKSLFKQGVQVVIKYGFFNSWMMAG